MCSAASVDTQRRLQKTQFVVQNTPAREQWGILRHEASPICGEKKSLLSENKKKRKEHAVPKKTRTNATVAWGPIGFENKKTRKMLEAHSR